MTVAAKPQQRASRVLEVLTGAATWTIITAPLWAALLFPGQWLYLFALFALYWLYRSSSLAIYGLLAYRRLRSGESRDWLGECKRLPGWDSIHHLVVFPSCGEPVEVLEESLRHVADQDYPTERVSVLVAFEERDPAALEKAMRLRSRFGSQFADLWVTLHPEVPDEPAGKGSNLAFAIPRARQLMLERGHLDLSKVLVTICDADSRLHSGYLGALTHSYLTDPNGRFCLYQPAVLFHANTERIPFYVRVVDGLYSVLQLARLMARYKLVTQSTYSLALSACHAIGYWDPEVIPEDSHMFFKMFFTWGERTRVKPIFLPVLADAAEGRTWWRAVVSHYRQARRWSWGVSDVPYVLLHAVSRRHIPLLPRILRSAHYVKEHVLWPCHWFLLVGGLHLVPHLTPNLDGASAVDWLSTVASTAFTASAPFLLVLLWLDHRLSNGRFRGLPAWEQWVYPVTWVLLPFLCLVLMVLPAVEAHTRLLLGRRLIYNVTEKMVGQPAAQASHSPARELVNQRAG